MSDNWKALYYAILSEARDEAWRLMCRNPMVRVYLWYREATDEGKWGKLMVANERPDECQFAATPEPIPRNITRECLLHWLMEKCGRLPIIGSMPCEDRHAVSGQDHGPDLPV